METTCKNHPDQIAKRKCFECKQPICSVCQVQKSHHVFCSQSCYRAYIIHKLSSSHTEQIARLKKLGEDYYHKIKKIPRRITLLSIVTLGLIVSIVISIINIHSVHNLRRELNTIQTLMFTTDSARTAEKIAQDLDTLQVISTPSNAMIIRNQFDIEGNAEDNRIITLSANGKLIKTTLVENGSFIFKGVLAKPGLNRFVVRSLSEDGASIVLEEIKFTYGLPSLSFLEKDFSRGNLDQKQIALTFDGDYLDNITAEILDILEQEGVHCTIFLTGRYMRRYGDLVKRMVAEGHEIGNHTWTHPHLTTFEQNRHHTTLPDITEQLVQQELFKTAELFRQITGKPMAPYWRSPYGEHNAEIRRWAAAAGFRHIGWTVGRSWDDGMDTLDWVADKSAKTYYSADEIAEKILSFGERELYGANGAVILMHLGSERNDDYPHLKLPQIIQQYQARGYQFVKVSEML